MPPLSKREKSAREVTKETERQRKIRKMQEERGWESSEEEELEEVDGSAFEKLIKSALEQSR